jgi:alpha-tubulin suppressor-like RCC1 family protein
MSPNPLWLVLPTALSGCLILEDAPISVDRAERLEANDDFESVGVSNQAACAISEDGLISCFGRDTGNDGVIEVPDQDFIAVAGSSGPQALFCGITSGDKLRCWGRRKGKANPVKKEPSDEAGWQAVTVGDRHACALDESGHATCWGDEDAHQLEVPDETFVKIEAAADHTCGLTTGWKVRCWGGGDEPPPFLSFLEGETARNLAVGEDFGCTSTLTGSSSHFSCYVDTGDAYFGVPEILYVETIEAGNRHFCALTDTGEITCYGADDHDQREVPEVDSAFSALSVGYEGACAVADGAVRCWGIMPQPRRAGY